MKKKLIGLYVILVFLGLPMKMVAVPGTPFPVKITQPDGTVITIRIHGDEYFNYKTTLDGYALMPDNAGFLNYAQLSSTGKLISTAVRATEIEKRSTIEKSIIQKLSSNPNLSKLSQIGRALRVKKMVSGSVPQKTYPLTGTPKSLVILVNFSDLSFLTPNPQTAFTNLLNQSGYSTNGGTGCAKDYFQVSSNGVFSPQFDVAGPFTLPHPMAYYGKNKFDGNDSLPGNMVIDGCILAAASGVNFAQYDTHKDGIVDNIFIYYAGYNEAEGGSPNSIWPHRWKVYPGVNYTGTVASTFFNGVQVIDYATTSELRGNSGSNMCGVGTFCHEFGHVLGLDDLYNTTVDNTYITLETFDIMDYGPYLNLGRTPPSYSSYERFYLNWLIPTELKLPGNYSLTSLLSGNKAYLISQNGNHNLNGANPNPVEFFMLENRQNTGWDTYIGMGSSINSKAAHGLLISHIYYNPTTWANNTPNNDKNAIGVDIVRADGIASNSTLAGDPFPGTSNVTTFNPILRNGTIINKPVISIKETDGQISFIYGIDIVPPIANDATDITFTSFIAQWSEVSNATGYYISVYSLLNRQSNYVVQDKWITLNSDTINNLIPETEYFYKIKASNKVLNYENITDFSNTISVKTLAYPFKTRLVVTANSNEVTVYLPTVKTILYVYNLLGQNVKTIIPQSTTIKITDLPKNQIYILKADNLVTKILN